VPDWRLSPVALESLEAQIAFLRPRNPRAAEALIAEIERSCANLAAFPGMGRAVAGTSLRVHVTRHYRYRIIYRALPDRIEIRDILHPSRR
jgi:plasmid stabilization system protein ParE